MKLRPCRACVVSLHLLLPAATLFAIPPVQRGSDRNQSILQKRPLRQPDVNGLEEMRLLMPSSATTEGNVFLQNFGFDTGDLTGWTVAGPVKIESLGSRPPVALFNEDDLFIEDEALRDGT